MGDYHVHLHPHGTYRGVGPEPGVYPQGHIEAYVAAAAARGLSEVGFTEHLYRCAESADLLGDFWAHEPRTDLAEHTEAFVRSDRTLSLERYVAAVVAAKDAGLPVLLGLEVDFFPETIGAVAEFLGSYPFDFLIGSVHWIGGWSADHTAVAYEFDRRGVDRAYEDYFALEIALAASGAVDVLAHVDVVKKALAPPRHPVPPIDLYREIVGAAAASGTAVEINGSGLRHPAGELFPQQSFLEMFAAAGIPITLGSDAHLPDRCGSHLDSAAAAARAAGYAQALHFRERRAASCALPEGVGP